MKFEAAFNNGVFPDDWKKVPLKKKDLKYAIVL